ncbi:kinase-like domain-containing protein [Mycena leptocephala]|nr:kinase-like domain-containing protein [Mycena leptocephala]
MSPLAKLPEHLAQDPGLAALVKSFQQFLEFSEDSASVLRLVQSYPGLVAEVTRVMNKSCTGSYPVAQGGFNTVFLLTFADALARLRRGPSSESAALPSDFLAQEFISEVATISFVRDHTLIPVPELYHSDSDAKNAFGTPYMLMKRIPGKSLGTSLTSREQRERVLSDVARIEVQLLRAPLRAIGSIVGDNDMPNTYAIRWFSLLLAAIRAVPPEEFDNPAHFALYHANLGLNNILVSPSGTVVGLVDWQSSAHESDRLQMIQRDIIFKETGIRPGSSRLHLSYLLHISAYSHSVLSSRAHLDRIFLQWFANVVSDGNEERLEPFLPLKLFIEIGWQRRRRRTMNAWRILPPELSFTIYPYVRDTAVVKDTRTRSRYVHDLVVVKDMGTRSRKSIYFTKIYDLHAVTSRSRYYVYLHVAFIDRNETREPVNGAFKLTSLIYFVQQPSNNRGIFEVVYHLLLRSPSRLDSTFHVMHIDTQMDAMSFSTLPQTSLFGAVLVTRELGLEDNVAIQPEVLGRNQWTGERRGRLFSVTTRWRVPEVGKFCARLVSPLAWYYQSNGLQNDEIFGNKCLINMLPGVHDTLIFR